MDSIMEIMAKNLLDTVFQPIVELCDGHVIGYEALSRGPENSDLYKPFKMISEARSQNMIDQLDSLFRDNALSNASKRGNSKLLFINMDATTLFRELADKKLFNPENYGISSESIVIEVSDSSILCGFTDFQNKVAQYKNLGFKIAIDDLGSDFVEYRVLSGICPEYAKIDNRFIRGIDQSEEKQKIVRSLMTLAQPAKTHLIAEGVETAEELTMLMEMGIYAAQGNFLGRPGRQFEEVYPEASELIQNYQTKSIQEKIMSQGIL